MLQISCSETNCLVTPLHSEENSCDFVSNVKKLLNVKLKIISLLWKYFLTLIGKVGWWQKVNDKKLYEFYNSREVTLLWWKQISRCKMSRQLNKIGNCDNKSERIVSLQLKYVSRRNFKSNIIVNHLLIKCKETFCKS